MGIDLVSMAGLTIPSSLKNYMASGSVVGLLAYVLIAPYCAAVFSTAVSALVMVVGSAQWPERFQWSALKEAP